MTIREWDYRTGSSLRRLVWGLDPLEKALVIAGGVAGFFGTWVLVVVWGLLFGSLFCK